jgi:hypothetical protein
MLLVRKRVGRSERGNAVTGIRDIAMCVRKVTKNYVENLLNMLKYTIELKGLVG